MENMPKQKPNDVDNFIKGAVKGFFTSAIFMGLFYTPLLISGLVSLTATTAITIAAAMSASILFNGIMTIFNGREQAKNYDHTAQGRGREQESITPAIAPTRATAVAANRTQETEVSLEHEWAQSVGSRGNNIEQILQNGSMSDKDRATAILAERESRIGQSQTL